MKREYIADFTQCKRCPYADSTQDAAQMKGEIMEITNGKMKIECKTLKGNKRPALIIQHDHLHSKVGMMMDDERAEEFMNYLSEFLRSRHD